MRTLAADMGAYNPVSYHNGSVWPHDSAIAAGLMRYGFHAEAQKIIAGLLAAARRLGDALPELYCGFDRSQFDSPVPYPTSCFPQAWAAAAPLLMLRTLLRFDPDIPAQVVHCDPAVPAELLPLRVSGVRLGERELAVTVARDGWDLLGLGPQITLCHNAAPPPAADDPPTLTAVPTG